MAPQEDDLLERVGRAINKNKKIQATQLLYNIHDDRDLNRKKWTDEDIRRALEKVDHPLLKMDDGYRLYENKSEWNCTFCEKLIKEKEGYWAYRRMYRSQGEKMCDYCFLKFLTIIEQNEPIYNILKNVCKKENNLCLEAWRRFPDFTK